MTKEECVLEFCVQNPKASHRDIMAMLKKHPQFGKGMSMTKIHRLKKQAAEMATLQNKLTQLVQEGWSFD